MSQFETGRRIRLPGEDGFVTIDGAIPSADGSWRLYVKDGGGVRPVVITATEVATVEQLAENGTADGRTVLAALWNEWMRAATLSARATALATTPLKPYPHQNVAVYGSMLPQPVLRFLLGDEPGTGKTIMGGLYAREAQRIGLVNRFLVVCPAHLARSSAVGGRFWAYRRALVLVSAVRSV